MVGFAKKTDHGVFGDTLGIMADRQSINPYAPTMTAEAEPVALQTDDLPPVGIEFRGQLDVMSVRQTDSVVLSIGLVTIVMIVVHSAGLPDQRMLLLTCLLEISGLGF